jgi:hypothetical protein
MNSRLTERELLNSLLRLLDRTTPHGTERTLAPLLPKGGIWDKADNYIVEVGTGSETLFAAHVDTVCTERMKTKVVCHHGMIFSKRKRCPIGADDKAGVLCLTAMIHANVPGVYVFHAGEECGGVGASHIAETMDLTRFKRAIEFDRRGKNSVITRMSWSSTCSAGFANTLCGRLGMGFQPDPTGIFTDVANYIEMIPEVTNISVGYQNNHRETETLDAGWLILKLIPKLCQIDWESLPVERDPAEAMRWRPGLYDYYCGYHGICDDLGDCCDMCGEPNGWIEEVDMDDGYVYILCQDCRSYYREQERMLETKETCQDVRQIELAM